MVLCTHFNVPTPVWRLTQGPESQLGREGQEPFLPKLWCLTLPLPRPHPSSSGADWKERAPAACRLLQKSRRASAPLTSRTGRLLSLNFYAVFRTLLRLPRARSC